MQQVEKRLVRILQDQIERTLPDKPDQALELCEELFRFALEVQDDLLSADANVYRGRAYAGLRKHDIALANFEEALRIYKEQHEYARRSRVLNSIGAVRQLKGERITAIRFYHSALQAARTAGDPSLQYKPLVNLAQILQAERNSEQALNFTERAITLAEKEGITDRLSKVYLMAARIYEQRSSYDQAYLSALSALEAAEREDNRALYSSASHTLALVEIKRGNIGEAERILTALLDYQQRSGLTSAEAVTAIELVKIWFKLRRHARAFNLLIDQIGKIRKAPKSYPPESFVIFKLVGDYCRFVQRDMEAANRYYTMYLQLTKGVWKTYLTD